MPSADTMVSAIEAVRVGEPLTPSTVRRDYSSDLLEVDGGRRDREEAPCSPPLAGEGASCKGRDYDAIEKTAPFGFDVGPDGSKVGELIGQLRWLASAGVETVFSWVVVVDQITPIEIVGREVIPAVAEFNQPLDM